MHCIQNKTNEDGGITVDFWIIKVQFPLNHRISGDHRIPLDPQSPHFHLKCPLKYQGESNEKDTINTLRVRSALNTSEKRKVAKYTLRNSKKGALTCFEKPIAIAILEKYICIDTCN